MMKEAYATHRVEKQVRHKKKRVIDENLRESPYKLTYTERFAHQLFNDGKTLKEISCMLIQAAIVKAGGNMGVAAKILGIPRTSIYFYLDRDADVTEERIKGSLDAEKDFE